MAITVNGKPDVPAPLPVVPRIGQVVYAASGTSTSIANGTGNVNLTGMSVTITPTSATSKIMVIVSTTFVIANTGGTQYGSGFAGVSRNGTSITSSVLGFYYPSSTTGTHFSLQNTYSVQHIDVPATTSAVTYNVYGNNIYPSPLMGGNSNGAGHIIAMEILA